MTKFLLDSGDPVDYKEISAKAKDTQHPLWGATTNPTLISRKLSGKKVSFDDAFFKLQRKIVEEILQIVPGAVSAEVYSDPATHASEMIKQGQEIATWDNRIVVKLPTTLEGFKARTALRKQGICINNTLVFSQEQSFAILMHEKFMIQMYGKPKTTWPCFISPFIGRLDDIGQSGISMLEHSLQTMTTHFDSATCWMLEASVRNIEQVQAGIDLDCQLETIRTTVFRDWLNLSSEQQKGIDIKKYSESFAEIPYWAPSEKLLQTTSLDEFMNSITTGVLDISHPLTTKGIEKFVTDWSTIIE